jgi:outer membrane lipopolysaccharide assembly protein LptE/RlpB
MIRLLVRSCLLLAALATFPGCGYHTGVANRLPSNLHTLAVPTFTNQTQTYKIEQVLTAAVVRELNTRTSFRISSQDSDSDAVLRGTVTSAQLAPLTYDSETGRASSALVTVTARVSLVDRKGRTLWENGNYTFREQYQVSRQLSSFFAEEDPAVDRLARDFARTLVSSVVEAY